MVTSVAAVASALVDRFNLGKAAGWDPVGLSFGDPEAAVERIAVCHEATPAVVDALIERRVDLVVSYHPLLFRPTRTLVAGKGASGRAFQLISQGIALLTVHTAFDVAPGGTADSLAAALGLVDTVGFAPAWPAETSKIVTFVPTAAADGVTEAMAQTGAGRIGGYSHCSYRSDGHGTFLAGRSTRPAAGEVGVLHTEAEARVEMIVSRNRVDAVVAAMIAAHPYEEPAYDVVDTRSNAGFIGRKGRLESPATFPEFTDTVERVLGGVIRQTEGNRVETVAVIPGSGGSLLDTTDVDVVVTGDVSHHHARAAHERGVAVIDPGHAATERPGLQALYASVAEIHTNAIDMTELDSDPWKER